MFTVLDRPDAGWQKLMYKGRLWNLGSIGTFQGTLKPKPEDRGAP